MKTKNFVPLKLFKRARLDRHFEDRCCGEEMTSNEIRLVRAYRGCSEYDQDGLNRLATAMMLARIHGVRAAPQQPRNIGKPVITIDRCECWSATRIRRTRGRSTHSKASRHRWAEIGQNRNMGPMRT
jgi:hypothetical protein